MRVPIMLILILTSSAVCQADDLAPTFSSISTRAACIENLKGTGEASIIFDAPAKTDKVDNLPINQEFLWDAQLVTATGQIVRVQLHCIRYKLSPQSDKEIIEAKLGYAAELVRQ